MVFLQLSEVTFKFLTRELTCGKDVLLHSCSFHAHCEAAGDQTLKAQCQIMKNLT